MPRAKRVEYPGGIYHVMERGDRRGDIFVDDVDRQDFLKTLAEACQKTGWPVHAYRENNSGELHRETAEQKANRIISEELSRRGWAESALASRRRSGPGKVAIAARLRKETTLPIKWIAARVQIGPAQGAESVLHHLAHRHVTSGLKS